MQWRGKAVIELFDALGGRDLILGNVLAADGDKLAELLISSDSVRLIPHWIWYPHSIFLIAVKKVLTGQVRGVFSAN